jgi:hypothetical protein
VITLDDGGELLARSVILALGVQYRRLPIPRIADYEGLGVAYAADSAQEQLRPSDAAVVVGGANSAGQTALSLAEEGRRVHLVVRADGLERSMARYLRDRIERDPNVEVLLGHEVRELGVTAIWSTLPSSTPAPASAGLSSPADIQFLYCVLSKMSEARLGTQSVMDLGLSGRKGIVCAASKGLGRAVAVALAREGVDVIINARGQQGLKAVAERIQCGDMRQRYSDFRRHHDRRG